MTQKECKKKMYKLMLYTILTFLGRFTEIHIFNYKTPGNIIYNTWGKKYDEREIKEEGKN